MAINPTSGATFYVTATDGTNAYIKTLTGRDYAASNIYDVSWRMTEVTKSMPLTMEALTAGTIKVNNPRPKMQYSRNGGAKAAVTSDAIDVVKGDKLQFYGTGTDVKTYYWGESDYTKIAGGTAEVKVYGNIMSMVDETGFATAITFDSENNFRLLFYGNDKLKDVSGLLLPATTLESYCYQQMFYGCSSLKTAPAKLPATTLADCCYEFMFRDCSSLETAPELPATTLDYYCYHSMFEGCTSLSAVTCLATNISARSCTKNWLNGVAATGTFTKAASMTDWPSSVSGIPSGWTVKDAQ